MSGYDTDEHTDIRELYKTSSVKKWIKIIPIEKMVLFDNYNRKDYFLHVADIVLDENKKRKTLIQFEPVISKKILLKSQNGSIYL